MIDPFTAMAAATTAVRQVPILPVRRRARSACYGVAVGTASRTTAVSPTATTTAPPSASTTSASASSSVNSPLMAGTRTVCFALRQGEGGAAPGLSETPRSPAPYLLPATTFY